MIDPKNVKKFVGDWSGTERGVEKSDTQSFWLELIEALGIDNPSKFIRFEKPIVVEERMRFIDASIAATKVLIEQKSRGVDLDKPLEQSDKKMLTPFEQARRYAISLPRSEMPRWIITCNFDEFRIYDLNQAPSLFALFDLEHECRLAPYVIRLSKLEFEYSRLNFLVDPNDEKVYPKLKISKEAVRIIRRIYGAFKSSYGEMDSARRDALNKLCVRIVFCFYADDCGLFEDVRFRDYIRQAVDKRRALIELFKVLDTREDERESDLDPTLKKFPYIDGGLFGGDELDIPPITAKLEHYLTDKEFSWREIDPPIFGTMFEQTLNSDLVRPGGMHYTSTDNIHKVIDPLFLDELHDEFRAICRKRKSNRRAALDEFQNKLASLKFLDPACGSGNFLTVTYLSLRELENEIFQVLKAIDDQIPCEIKVSLEQFGGIEINDYAVAVAQTAMYISENQMLQETENILREEFSPFPLERSARIVCGNALELDWRDVVPGGVDYIIGNPPFSGARIMSAEKKSELLRVFDGWKNAGNLDYVCCWFKRTAEFMLGTQIRAALVSTNSICQGESVGTLWSRLLEIVHIDFAHRTFRWTQETEEERKARELNPNRLPAPKDTATVYCVIVGFSATSNQTPKYIYDGKQKIEAMNINGYLLAADNFYVESQSKPLCDVPPIGIGNKPIDGGYYLFTRDEYEKFIVAAPRTKKYFRPWYGAQEFLKGRPRYCLWLGDSPLEEVMGVPLIAERVEAVRQYRRASKSTPTRKIADRPTHFHVENMPTETFIVIPEVTSGERKYIPMGFMPPTVLCSNKLKLMPHANKYHFGVMESSVHMAWVRVVCGRLGTGYDYSAKIVYNNFPWCTPTKAQRRKIERTAQRILDVRTRYPDRSLAQLYNDATMPSDLRRAHEANDRAVLDAYGFDRDLSELEIVSRLMVLYQGLARNEKGD